MNPEPLGVVLNVTSISSIKRWSELSPSNFLTDYSTTGEVPNHVTSPFSCDPEINHKIILW